MSSLLICQLFVNETDLPFPIFFFSKEKFGNKKGVKQM